MTMHSDVYLNSYYIYDLYQYIEMSNNELLVQIIAISALNYSISRISPITNSTIFNQRIAFPEKPYADWISRIMLV